MTVQNNSPSLWCQPVYMLVRSYVCRRDLWSFEIRFEFERPFRFDSKVMGRFENFWISHPCPLLVVVKWIKPLMALNGTVHRLSSSMSDHMPVYFNVFEDWNEESEVPHTSFISFVINYYSAVYTADSIWDLIWIRIVMPDSISIWFERKWPIRSPSAEQWTFSRSHLRQQLSITVHRSSTGKKFSRSNVMCHSDITKNLTLVLLRI